MAKGLPFSSEVNVGHIIKFIPENTSIESFNEQLKQRFHHLQDFKRENGLDIHTKIDFGLAIALVDDEVFDDVISEIIELSEDKEVADHEIGHSLVAESLGWVTKSITVVPGASYRGLTEAVPQTNLSFEDFALQFAAICYGGSTAAQMMGNHMQGEGSDHAKTRALARAVVNQPFSKYQSEEGFLKEAQSLAHGALSRHWATGIHKQARRLAAAGTQA